MTDKLLASFQAMLDAVIQAAPKVATVIVLLIVALFVAKLVERILRVILVRVRFDSLIGRAGIDKIFESIGFRRDLSQVIPRLAYYLLLFLVAKTISDALGWVALSSALSSFFGYLPSLLSALILLLLGSALGPFVGGLISRGAESSGLDFGPALGRVVSALIVFLAGIMALGQLQIDTEIIRLVAALCLAGLALAFGLSFGLGSRDITRNIMAGFYARKLLRVGEPVEIQGQKGILRALTTTHAVIESGERTVHVAHGRFLDEVSAQGE